jgi:hypothetical protein
VCVLNHKGCGKLVFGYREPEEEILFVLKQPLP